MNRDVIHINGRDDWHPLDYAAARYGSDGSCGVTLATIETWRALERQASLLFELVNGSRGGLGFVAAVESWRKFFLGLEGKYGGLR